MLFTYTIWRETLVPQKFGEIDNQSKTSKFSPSKILHIYSKVSCECSNVNFTVSYACACETGIVFYPCACETGICDKWTRWATTKTKWLLK